MKIKIKGNKQFDLSRPPLIIAEISEIIVKQKLFLRHIREAAKNGADLIKIQTYEPEDITVNEKKIFLKLKMEFGKESIYGIYTKKFTHLLNGIMMLLN